MVLKRRISDLGSVKERAHNFVSKSPEALSTVAGFFELPGEFTGRDVFVRLGLSIMEIRSTVNHDTVSFFVLQLERIHDRSEFAPPRLSDQMYCHFLFCLVNRKLKV
jgi:hypothetical protein